MTSPQREPASAAAIVRWIEKRCLVPEGKLIGEKFKLADWQIEALKAIYDNPHPGGTRRAILSFGRKNGKTALAALLLLVHLCGPRYRPNSQLFSTAQSREQAALIFQFASKIVRMSPSLRDIVVIREAAKELLCPDLGTRYRALSAEASTAFGLSPCFHVADELGQVITSNIASLSALDALEPRLASRLAAGVIHLSAPDWRSAHRGARRAGAPSSAEVEEGAASRAK